MNGLRIQLLGAFSIYAGQDVETRLGAGKVRELLCYLLLNRDRHLPREMLASVFWGDEATTLSRKHLRQTLWNLHLSLDPIGRESGLLRVEPESVYLDSGAGLWLDVDVFERASSHARGVAGQDLSPALADELRRGVALYRGDLLEGCYQDWCVVARDRLQSSYILMMEKLMVYAELHGSYEEGLSYGSRILHLDGARETTHRLMMRLYYLSGDRTAALRQYQRCTEALMMELAVLPTETTKVLLEDIRADRLIDEGAPFAGASPSAHAMQDRIARLRHLRSALTEMQSQVQNELHTIDTLLARTSHEPRRDPSTLM